MTGLKNRNLLLWWAFEIALVLMLPTSAVSQSLLGRVRSTSPTTEVAAPVPAPVATPMQPRRPVQSPSRAVVKPATSPATAVAPKALAGSSKHSDYFELQPDQVNGLTRKIESAQDSVRLNPEPGQPCPGCAQLASISGNSILTQYPYEDCKNTSNIAVRNLPPDGSEELNVIRWYQLKPAQGPTAQCIFLAQSEAEDPKLRSCSGPEGLTLDRRPEPTCLSAELHRMIANAFDDMVECLGPIDAEDRRNILNLTWKESNFMPNIVLETRSSRFFGPGQYTEQTWTGNQRKIEENKARLFSKNTNECKRIRAVFKSVPSEYLGSPKRGVQLACWSLSFPQQMLVNLLFVGVDYMNARNLALYRIKQRNLSGTSGQALPVARVAALLNHMGGSGEAEVALGSFLDGFTGAGQQQQKTNFTASAFTALIKARKELDQIRFERLKKNRERSQSCMR